MKIYAIKDLKIGFEQTFNMPNDMAAARQFGEACKNPEAPMAKYPEDYELYSLGEYNKETGEIKPEVKIVAKATAYVTQE